MSAEQYDFFQLQTVLRRQAKERDDQSQHIIIVVKTELETNRRPAVTQCLNASQLANIASMAS